MSLPKKIKSFRMRIIRSVLRENVAMDNLEINLTTLNPKEFIILIDELLEFVQEESKKKKDPNEDKKIKKLKTLKSKINIENKNYIATETFTLLEKLKNVKNTDFLEEILENKLIISSVRLKIKLYSLISKFSKKEMSEKKVKDIVLDNLLELKQKTQEVLDSKEEKSIKVYIKTSDQISDKLGYLPQIVTYSINRCYSFFMSDPEVLKKGKGTGHVAIEVTAGKKSVYISFCNIRDKDDGENKKEMEGCFYNIGDDNYFENEIINKELESSEKYYHCYQLNSLKVNELLKKNYTILEEAIKKCGLNFNLLSSTFLGGLYYTKTYNCTSFSHFLLLEGGLQELLSSRIPENIKRVALGASIGAGVGWMLEQRFKKTEEEPKKTDLDSGAKGAVIAFLAFIAGLWGFVTRNPFLFTTPTVGILIGLGSMSSKSKIYLLTTPADLMREVINASEREQKKKNEDEKRIFKLC